MKTVKWKMGGSVLKGHPMELILALRSVGILLTWTNTIAMTVMSIIHFQR